MYEKWQPIQTHCANIPRVLGDREKEHDETEELFKILSVPVAVVSWDELGICNLDFQLLFFVSSFETISADLL